MLFLTPLALALALALPVTIFLLHLLRGSRWRVRVPATFLWAGLAPSVAGHSRPRLPRLTLLLLLQLIAAGLSGITLARPAVPLAEPGRHVVLVLDASASMQATDVVPSRFEAARTRALDRLATLGPSDEVSLVRAGPSATLLVSGSPDQVREALSQVQPGDGPGALHDAIALASQQIARTPDLRGQILVFTDGAFPPLEPVGALAAPVEFVSVPVNPGTGNQAIVAVQVRSQPSAPDRRTAYIELANLDDRPASLPVRIADAANSREIARQTVELPANSAGSLLVELPGDLSRLAIQLDRPQPDALPLDDRAEVDAPLLGTRSLRVQLVSPAPTALRHALEAIPAVQLAVIGPDAYQATGTGADITVFDSFLPPELPRAPLLIVNPPGGNRLLPVLGTFTTTSLTTVDTGHPLLRSVDIAALTGAVGKSIARVPWARPEVAAGEGPLILEGYDRGYPLVIFTFDPAQSGLDKSLAFPLLVSNAIGYLIADRSGRTVAPGDPIALPAPSGGRALLIRPDGRRQIVEPADPASGELWIRDTERTGRYLVLDAENVQTVLFSFSVNLFDRAESDIRPRRDLAPLPANVQAGLPVAETAELPVKEWWRLLATALVALVGLEWLVFTRRG